MNHCMIQQNAFPACEDMRSTVSIPDRRDTVLCPKPRRIGLVFNAFNDPVQSLRWHISHQQESIDSKAGADLLDMVLAKGGYCSDQVASSPPFFCGSPPSRVANPLVQDASFGQEKLPMPPSCLSPVRKGCTMTKFGPTPAAVRIEGFNCLDRDRQNRRISGVA